VSLIIFAGIVSRLPQDISQAIFSFDASQVPVYAGFLAAAIAVVAAVVIISEAERPVPVTYAKRVRGMNMTAGGSTYSRYALTRRVSSRLSLHSRSSSSRRCLRALLDLSHPILVNIAQSILSAFQNLALYGGLYFIFVFFFTYFYTAVTFDPKQISENLQKNGAFIPGVRPGGSTLNI